MSATNSRLSSFLENSANHWNGTSTMYLLQGLGGLSSVVDWSDYTE